MQPANYQQIESRVSGAEGSYPDLAAEALLTSTADLKTIVDSLGNAQSWVELGSGYGLGTLLFAQSYPEKVALGLEFEAPRYEESLRLKQLWGVENAYFQHANLRDCVIPQADAYFLYFPTGPVLDRILHVLGSRENSFQLIAIESHGDLLPRLEAESWLKLEGELPLSSARHYPHAKVFRKQGRKAPSLMDLSFQDKLLLIQDENGAQWLGESRNMEWLDQQRINLKIPYRTIRQDQVLRVLDWQEVSADVKKWLDKRRAGADLRKIFVQPEFLIERADGSLVESDH